MSFFRLNYIPSIHIYSYKTIHEALLWQIHSWDQNHLHQLKANSFWAVKASQNCSWTWRKYLGFRLIIWEWMIHATGDWKNHLSVMRLKAPDDRLMEKYNGRVMFENGIPWNAKAVALINNNCWHWLRWTCEHPICFLWYTVPSKVYGKLEGPKVVGWRGLNYYGSP